MSGYSGVPPQYRDLLEVRRESELNIIVQNTMFYDIQKYSDNGNPILEVERLDTPNVWETIGDAASVASLELNIASLGCAFALVSVLADSIPLLAPDLKAAYNPVAQRFIKETTKRFIPTTTGLAKYYTWPSIGVGIYTGSSFLTGESE